MVKLMKQLILIQVTIIILSHVILKTDAGIAGLIASAALMAMFRPKVIPVPIPLPVPVPVPIRGKSPLNIFGSHSEQSNSQSFPNFPNHSYLQYPFPHQHPPPPLISPLALPYLHPGYPPYSHLYPPIGHSLIPPSAPVPSPNFSPYPSIPDQQQLMATNQLSQKMILPYGLLSHPHGSSYHQHHINRQVYHPSPLIGQHNLYPHGTIHPSTYYSGPFVILIQIKNKL